MQSQVKQLYHCDRCGKVFRSSIKPLDELACTQCGMPPVRDGFAQLAQMPALDHSLLDSDHGIAGRDEADFFSMQKRKKQQRAIIVYICWFVLLLSVAGVALYVKKKHDEREKERDAINKDIKDHELREAKALRECVIAFQNFGKSSGENQRARYIYNGTDYLVRIREYYKNPLNKEPYKDKTLLIAGEELVEEEGQPKRLDLLIKIDHDKRFDQYFEAVFWQKNDKWYLDWPQFVRSGEMDWDAFVKNENIQGDYTFRLYVRKRGTDTDNEDFTELVLLKGNNIKDDVSGESRSVLVRKGSKLEEEILNHINKERILQQRGKKVRGSFDILGQARVRVTVGYESIGDRRVLILKKLLAKDWFSPHGDTDQDTEEKPKK